MLNDYDRFSIGRASLMDSWVDGLFDNMERLRLQTSQDVETVARVLEDEFIGMGEQYLDWYENQD